VVVDTRVTNITGKTERISQTTEKVITYLKANSRVEKVLFPFDISFPQYTLAKKQMKGACGLLTFVIKAKNIATIETFCETLQHILMAVSWGGHESLIIPRCAGIRPERFIASSEDHRMLRLYCGLEDADYIISDLERGFSAIKEME